MSTQDALASAVKSSRRSVILGTFAGLPIRDIEPFVRSLRATGFEGRVIIIAAGYDERERETLAGLVDRVTLVDHDYGGAPPWGASILKVLRRQRGLRRSYPSAFQLLARAARERESPERWRRLEYHLEGLQSLRYTHYYRCLIEDAPDAELVMLTDVRDVVFQRDPFAEPVSTLELYLEDESVRIGDDVFNTSWIRDLYGHSAAVAMSGRPVSCSGTVIGTREAILRYLFEMATEIASRRRPMGAHDQGVHNALVHRNRLGPIQVVPNERGRVVTLGRMRSFRTNSAGFVVNVDGSVPAVVHQWDRHAAAVSELAAFRFLNEGRTSAREDRDEAPLTAPRP